MSKNSRIVLPADRMLDRYWCCEGRFVDPAVRFAADYSVKYVQGEVESDQLLFQRKIMKLKNLNNPKFAEFLVS